MYSTIHLKLATTSLYAVGMSLLSIVDPYHQPLMPSLYRVSACKKGAKAAQGVERPIQSPRVRVAALLKGAEQPDVETPRWSACTVPLIWWPSRCGPCVTGY